MNLKRISAGMIILTLALSASACGGGGGLLGDEFASQEGGFTLRKPLGYSFEMDGAVAIFTAPDAQAEIGPMLMVMGGPAEGLSNEDLLENTTADLNVMEFGKGKKVTINGVKGLLAGGAAEVDGQEVEGQLFVAMVSPTQQFTLLGFAPKDRARDFLPVFDAVLDSVNFFEPGGAVPAASDGGQMAEAPVAAEPQPLRQWASSADASSEYSSGDYSAARAAGAPDVEECGDNPGAWASLDAYSEDWLELFYDVPVLPVEINIYQSFNPSQVVEVQMVDTEGTTWVAWTGEPESVENCPDLMTITLELDEPVYVNQVVIFVDQSVKGWGWAEIDAVELVGYPAGQMPAASGGEPPAAAQAPSGGGGASAFSTGGLAGGAFVYSVSGYENDLIENNYVTYNSTSQTYDVVLISGGTGRYALNLMLPKEGLKKGRVDLVTYDDQSAAKHYMAVVFINAFPYKNSDGWIDIESDPGSGKLTATFSFNAQSSDFPDRFVKVEGALKDVPLQ